jgi:cytochrome c556
MTQGFRFTTVLVAAIVMTSAAALAADVIQERQTLMKHNGAAAKTVVGMLKGAAPFDLAKVQDALKTFATAAKDGPTLFPDNSKTGGDTEALPAIWENKADFDAHFTQLGKDVAAAQTAIVDEASFKQAMPAVFKNCGACHEHYRAKKD